MSHPIPTPRLSDRLNGSISRLVAEAFHDVFGEEDPSVFFFAANRVIVDGVDNQDIGWMHGGSVRELEDVYELVSEYIHINRREGRCCRSRRRWGDCRDQLTVIP